MKVSLFFLCTFTLIHCSEKKKTMFNADKIERSYLDSACMEDSAIKQCCYIFSSVLNDSLKDKLGANELQGYNFSPKCNNKPLLITQEGNYLKGEIFYFANKDWIQKLHIKRTEGELLFVEMKLKKKGTIDDMWFHKLTFSYDNSGKKISKIILEDLN
jgi:hypothetical protein